MSGIILAVASRYCRAPWVLNVVWLYELIKTIIKIAGFLPALLKDFIEVAYKRLAARFLRPGQAQPDTSFAARRHRKPVPERRFGARLVGVDRAHFAIDHITVKRVLEIALRPIRPPKPLRVRLVFGEEPLGRIAFKGWRGAKDVISERLVLGAYCRRVGLPQNGPFPVIVAVAPP
jgi:hypothetical protein